MLAHVISFQSSSVYYIYGKSLYVSYSVSSARTFSVFRVSLASFVRVVRTGAYIEITIIESSVHGEDQLMHYPGERHINNNALHLLPCLAS